MKPTRGLPRTEDALDSVRAVYAELARRPVDRTCRATTRCCRFRLTGEVPNLTLGEAYLALQSWKSSGRKPLALDLSSSAICPFLNDATGLCRIYDGRPFACRTHFCGPAGGPYPRKQVSDLINSLERIDQELGGEGVGISFPAAIRQALTQFR
jgi:uncharacterized protein